MNPVLIVGGALLLYLWFQSQALSLPSDAAYITSAPVGTALAVPQTFASGANATQGPATTAITYLYYGPSEKAYYLVTTAPTQAQIAAGAALTTATPAGSTTGSGVTATGTGAGTSGPIVGSSGSGDTALTANGQPLQYKGPSSSMLSTPTTLSGLWAAIQQWAAADTNFTNSGGVISGPPDHWNFYVAYIWPNAPTGFTGGAWPPDLNSIFPGYNPNASMTGSQFWSGMGMYLQQGGLSGIQGLSGLGGITPFVVRGPGGWAA